MAGLSLWYSATRQSTEQSNRPCLLRASDPHIEPTQTITKATAEFTWHTAVRRQERTVQIEATTQASVVTVQHNDKQLDLLLEPPDHLGSWLSQCKELRRIVKTKFNGSNSDRHKLFKYIAELESWVPNLRSATTSTIHASQGSSYEHVFLSRDIHSHLLLILLMPNAWPVAVSRIRETLQRQPPRRLSMTIPLLP